MSTYKEISGKTIKQLSSDPTSSEFEGQIWFNTTAGVFKSVVASGAWASDSSLVTARQATSAAGTMSAMFAAGGSNEPAVATNEHYNGSGWSSAEALPAGRAGSGLAFGTQTAGVYFCGTSADPATRNNDTYEYDGTNWTGGGAYPTSLTNLGSSGTLTAGLGFGGDPVSAVTAEYNGTSWTASGSLNTAREGVAFSSAGTQTASLCAGGYNNPPGPRTNVEAYDGSSWSEVNDLPVARSSTSGAGTETNTIVIGGEISTGITNTCVQYDGTNWAAIPSMATARFQTGTAGPGTGALAISGSGPGLIPTNEQYNFTATVITPGAWASGASMNTAAYGRGGCGTTTAGLVFGGYPGPTANTETYDGTSYTEVNNLATARRYIAGFGTQTAAVAAGGNFPPGRSTAVEEWNGSSWTANPNSLPTAVQTLRGTGTATAGLVYGGNTGASGATTANTQTFDGTSWSEVNNLNTSRSGLGGAGTQTATLAYGGRTGTGTSTIKPTESWDGSSWTTSPSPLIAARNNMGAAGTNTAAMSFGGNSGNTSTQNNDYYLYNDTTWITQPSMAVARSYIAGFGTSTSAIGAGGYGPAFNPNQARTEEFTGEIPTLDYKTLTSS